MVNNSFTIFGKGFVGTSFSNFLKKKKIKFFFPKKGKYKFNKNLGHIIYCIGNQNWLKHLDKTFEANLTMVGKIIFNNRFKSFTLVSSTRVYFANSENKTDEEEFIKIKPSNKDFLYNSLKIAAENLCLSLNNKNIKVVRISNLYGNNFTNQSYILPTWIKNSINKKTINLFINKDSTKDYIFVDDAFEILLKIIKKSKFRLYNIASGKNIKLSMILNEIKRNTNCKIRYKKNSKLIKEPKININRIKKEFNFKLKDNLIDSISQLIIDYKKKLKK